MVVLSYLFIILRGTQNEYSSDVKETHFCSSSSSTELAVQQVLRRFHTRCLAFNKSNPTATAINAVQVVVSNAVILPPVQHVVSCVFYVKVLFIKKPTEPKI